MNHEVLGNRRRALEESFFARQNNKLLEQLRSQSAAEELKKQLSEIFVVGNLIFSHFFGIFSKNALISLVLNGFGVVFQAI